MGKGSLKDKSDRLARLLGLLRSDDFWTTSNLSKELRVSHRTLMRDLAEMKEVGYPLESDRGRGGGVRLVGRWGLDKLSITSREAISLLLSLSILELMNPSRDELKVIQLKQKIASAFPEHQRKLILQLRKRIFIGKTASSQVLTGFKVSAHSVFDEVMLAFFEGKRIRIDYRDEKSKSSSREMDPHFLFVNWPVWYILGWDYLKSDVRMFRVDRIVLCNALSTAIIPRPKTIFTEEFDNYFKHL